MRNAMWVGGGITGMGEIPMLGVKEKGIAKVIRDIFRKGENGFFYDPSDMESMYQDAAGTTELKSTGQPTGLMLDKSMGLALGPELFDDSKVILQGAVRLERGLYRIKTAGPLIFFRPYSDYSGNKRLRVEYEITEVVEGTIRTDVTLDGSKGVAIRTAIGKYITYIYGSSLAFTRESTPTDVSIRILSIKEVLGNHGYQNTSAARPILIQKPILGNDLAQGKEWEGSSVNNLTEKLADGRYRLTTKSTAASRMGMSLPLVLGRTYSIEIDVEATGLPVIVRTFTAAFSEIGSVVIGTVPANTRTVLKSTFTATDASIRVGGTMPSSVIDMSFILGSVSVQEITGYSTDQNHIAFDGVDDKLITNLPAPLTNATVLRAIPNVGTEVKYNQSLPMLYEDSTNHAGLIAIDRALTRSEQLRLMTELDKKAGATSLETLTFKAFDNNQEGFVYDPNDLSTLYQDAAGTVPVTKAGQPVGLLLDKSKGLVLGPELIVNGNFSGNSNWTVTSVDDTHFVDFTADGARFYSATRTPIMGLRNSAALVLGKWYRIEVTTAGNVVGAIKSDGFIPGNLVLSGTQEGTYVTYAQAKVDSLAIIRNADVVDMTIKSVSVKELVGNHAYQTTSASRPILRKNAVTGANYLEFDGSDDFLQTGNIDFSGTDKVSLFTGVAKLANNVQVIAETSLGALTNAGSFYLVTGTNAGGNGYTSVSRGTGAFTGGHIASNFTYPAPDIAVLSVKHDISGDLSSMRRNSVIGVEGLEDKGSGNFGNYPLYIGRRAGTSLPFNGHIYGLIGIGKLVSDDETTVIEKELAKRTGVTLNV